MVIIGAKIPTEIMLMSLKAAIELQPRPAAQQLYTATFVRPPVIVTQNFGLLQLSVIERTCSPGAGVDHTRVT